MVRDSGIEIQLEHAAPKAIAKKSRGWGIIECCAWYLSGCRCPGVIAASCVPTDLAEAGLKTGKVACQGPWLVQRTGVAGGGTTDLTNNQITRSFIIASDGDVYNICFTETIVLGADIEVVKFQT